MKLKTIITISLAASLMAGVTSCEDILKVDSKTVMYDYQNTLDNVTDTVYSVLGIIKQLQKVADRAVILGEIRGDLVKITDHASDDLRELYGYDFNKVSTTNKYDQAVDYYSIINNCNFFLANADTSYVRNNENVFKKEYIVLLCYRAWAYLQLAQIYGEVPYFDKPVTGDVKVGDNKMNIRDLARTLLLDFKEEYKDYKLPDYGKIGGETSGDGVKAAQHETRELFIPVRLIMGDLYLWAEDYPNAALCYHDYLNKRGSNSKNTTGTNSARWRDFDFLYHGTDTYASLFGNDGYICYIPMEYDPYSGIVSNLKNVFNSTVDNDYWYQLTRSQALTAISVRQNYCYHAKRSELNLNEWAAYIPDKSSEEEKLWRGDLRLQSILETSTRVQDDDDLNSSNYGTEMQTLNKINSEKVWLYRKDVVYLRLAEALNRCGLPETAFAILKYGLCTENIEDISQVEKDRAKKLNISSVYEWERSVFQKGSQYWRNATVSGIGGKDIDVYESYWRSGNTIGIHARGCGDVFYDDNYRIPVDTVLIKTKTADLALEDSIRAVEEMLIDEMALETCFEGYRFGDLMRISMHRAADVQSPSYGGFAENSFLAKRVAIREIASEKDSEPIDIKLSDGDELYKKLCGVDEHKLNKNWFLVLPDERKTEE